MITGVHTIIYSDRAEQLREFFRDVLGWDALDAGGGWLIFSLPPAELAVHPSDGSNRHELYLMCDDLEATMKELLAKGVDFVEPVAEQRWGRTTAIGLPGGGHLALYQPSHPRPPAS